jgi:hypothetical protein
MAKKQPIVLTEGQQEQLQNGDYLPNQPEIDELRRILAKVIRGLNYLGIEFLDEDINSFQNKNI